MQRRNGRNPHATAELGRQKSLAQATSRWVLAFLGVFSLLALVSCSNGDDTSNTGTVVQSFSVGTAGRTIDYTSADHPDIQIAMTVPSGAVADGTVFTIETLAAEAGMIPGMVFEFGPDGIEIPSTVELVLTYDPATLSVDEELLSIYKQVGDAWQQLPSTVYPDAHKIVALLDGFSRYGVGSVITTATPGWGHYFEAIEVVLTCDDGSGSPCKATYYTVDGSAPTTASLEYSAPIPIKTATTLRFFSVSETGTREPIRLSTYSIETGQEWDRPTTTATPAGGNHPGAVTVALTCDDGEGGSGCAATYYVTGDGPLSSRSPRYTTPLAVDTTTTLRFFSVDNDGNRELGNREIYLLRADRDADPPSTSATPAGGYYNSIQSVSFSCDDGGGVGCAGVYYTTDGTEPTTSSDRFRFPLQLTDTTTLKFFSVDLMGNSEGVQTEDYTIYIPHTVGGTVSGLDGTLILQNNRTDDLRITADGSFTFATPLVEPDSYAIEVLSRPATQSCTITNGFGPIRDADVTSIVVTCVTDKYNVGGTVSGLEGTLVLQNNGMGDLTITADGSFVFANPALGSESYAVEVVDFPFTQSCTVANGSGPIQGADVTDIEVTCVTTRPAYTVGGTVSGLDGTLVLQNNRADDLTITADGSFTFATPLVEPDTYAIEVASEPYTQTCTITNGFGPIRDADVTNVAVTCVTDVASYTVGVTVSGLAGTLVLQNNRTDDLTIAADGRFTFATQMVDPDTYAIEVFSQPTAQTCTITDGFGSIRDVGVTEPSVTCVNTGDLATGQAVFGPIVDGTVAIYDLADLSTAVFNGTTSNNNYLDLGGRIQLDVSGFSDAALYLVVVTGGEDIDHDNDGVVDPVATPMLGSVHALLPGTQLKAGDWFVSAVTEAAYRSALYLLQAEYDVATVIQSLDSSARGLLTADRNGDGTVDHLDLALWHPLTHSESTQLPPATRDIIAEEARTGLPVRDLAQANSGWIRSLPLGDVANVEVVRGTAYVVIDEPCSLQVVDVSDPRTAEIVGSVSMSGGCSWLSDLEVVGSTVFAVGDGLHVIDVTEPTSPSVMGSYYLLPGSAEDIRSNVIRVRGTTAFITPYGSWSTGHGGTLMAVDISDPAAPVVLDTFFPGTSNEEGLDIQIAGDTAYFLVGTYSDDNLIVDISDPAAMTQVGTLAVDANGSSPRYAAVDGDYLYTVEPYRMAISDISTPGAPQVVGELVPPNATTFGQQFSGGVEVVGGLAYVGGKERIFVIDVTVPATPKIVGHVPAPSAGGAPEGFDVFGGLVYVGNTYSGLQIIDITDPAVRGVIGSVAVSGTADVEASGSIAYLAAEAGLEIVDLSDPTTPYVVGNVPSADLLTGQPHLALAPTGDFLFYGAWSSYAGGLNVVDASDPAAPLVAAQHPEYPQVSGLAIGDYLYVAYRPIAYYPSTAMPQFQSLGYTNPAALSVAGDFGSSKVARGLAVGPGGVDTEVLYFYYNTCSSPPNYTSILMGQEVDAQGDIVIASGELPSFTFPQGECLGDVAVSGDVALVTTRSDFGDHLFSLDISDPLAITYLDRIDAFSNDEKRVKAVGGSVYVAANSAGMLIADIELDGTLTPVALVKTPGIAADVAITGDFAVISDGDALRVFRLPVRVVP